MCGSSLEIDLYDAVEVGGRIGFDLFVSHEEVVVLVSQLRQLASARGRRGRVAMRWSYGNIEVVAPSSAPILVMVAFPVALIERRLVQSTR